MIPYYYKSLEIISLSFKIIANLSHRNISIDAEHITKMTEIMKFDCDWQSTLKYPKDCSCFFCLCLGFGFFFFFWFCCEVRVFFLLCFFNSEFQDKQNFQLDIRRKNHNESSRTLKQVSYTDYGISITGNTVIIIVCGWLLWWS